MSLKMQKFRILKKIVTQENKERKMSPKIQPNLAILTGYVSKNKDLF